MTCCQRFTIDVVVVIFGVVFSVFGHSLKGSWRHLAQICSYQYTPVNESNFLPRTFATDGKRANRFCFVDILFHNLCRILNVFLVMASHIIIMDPASVHYPVIYSLLTTIACMTSVPDNKLHRS